VSKGILASVEVPWQEVISIEWQLSQVKRHYDIILGKMLQNEPQSHQDIEVPYLKSQHVQWDKIVAEDLPKMWASPAEVDSLRVNIGDLLVCEGGEVGRASIVMITLPKNCIIQNALHLVRPRISGNTHFLRYLLQHAVLHEWLDVLCNRSTIAHFTVEKFAQMWIWLPSFLDQKIIANYLDQETAKIDAMISAKERLLVLLTEKRQALITHAVTRGLNPNVPLRDSGIDWIGKIPDHWEVTRLRWFILTLEQGWSPQAEEQEPSEEEWGVLKLNAVKGGQFDSSKAKTLPASIDIPVSLEIQSGDFLLTRANTPDLVGDVCYVEQTRPRLMLSDLIYRLKIDELRLDRKFLSFFLQSAIGRLQIKSDARGSSNSMVKISQEHILDWFLLYPEIAEQKAIAAYLDAALSKLEHLSAATQKSINLLQERRAALISAAVTGQINIPQEKLYAAK
jgi:type I restriction enzyme, S subunit